MERRQQRHHPQPRPRPAAAPPEEAAARPAAKPRVRLRDPGDPRRRRARSHHRRPCDADLSDDGLCVRRRRPRRLALQPAQFRLHLFPADQPDGGGARGTDRGARGRSSGGGRRIGACGAVPRVLHPDGAGRRIRRLAQPLRRLAHPIRVVVQETRLDLPFRRPHRAGELPQGADAALQSDLHREPREPRRHCRGHRARRRDRAYGGRAADRRQHARDPVPLPADRARRRHCRSFDDEVLVGARKRARRRRGRVRGNSTGRRAAASPR